MEQENTDKWPWMVKFIRGLLVFNYVLFSTSFLPHFQTFPIMQLSLADRLFGGGNGFRIDVIFLFFSSILIFVALIVFLTELRSRKAAKWDAFASLMWLILFLYSISINLG